MIVDNTMSDLDIELEEGQMAAKRLARHLISMGADKATLSVLIADEKYEVVVRHVPVVLEPEAA